MNKLKNFPSVFYVSLEESIDRQDNIKSQFNEYEINPIPLISKRYSESTDVVNGRYVHEMNPGTIGCAVSHLKAIKKWYDETDESYAFFCEDDLSLETVKYWNFTWEEFIESIPEDADCVQLLCLRESGSFSDFRFRRREWNDWSVTAYIITRDYAEKIIKNHCIENEYRLEINGMSCMPLVEYIIFNHGVTYSLPLFVEDPKFQSTFIKSSDHNHELHADTHLKSHEIVLDWWKTEGKTLTMDNLISNKVRDKRIVDYFTFFAPTGKEMLKLRINMLKEYVDEFVICESNKTQSGNSIQYELRGILKELNLSENNIRIIELDIPDDEKLDIQEIDKYNCYDNNSHNLNSVRARVRDRMQKDALLSVISDYSDDTVFIHSDIDEIISPNIIDYISNSAKNYSDVVIRVPLVHLEGRADMRVYNKDSNQPKEWTGMFVTTKKHLERATPTQIRSNVFNPYPIVFLTENGKTLEDLGWHFSWMGSSDIRKAKCKAFTHYDDEFDYLVTSKYKNDDTVIFQNNLIVAENQTPPSGIKNTILKKYPIENLPKEIFESSTIKNFLLPEVKTTSDTFKIEYENACNTPSDINENLPILFEFANKCNHVTEMGVRYGTSTRAFLNTDVILRSYDVFIDEEVSDLFKIAKTYGKNVEYIKSDVREIEIEETDLLFIDTWHCYDQLKTELKLHHHKVKKYIIFHDTHTYGVKGEESEIGLLPAIIEFLIEFPEWKFILHKINNNGLTVIEKNNNNQKLLQKIKIKTEIEKPLTNYALNPENPETNIEKLLVDYSLDTENGKHNFNLGFWYESEGHTAPAVSYYLRSAERSQDENLSYEALIRASHCYAKQGTRDLSSKCFLQQALSLCPNRPEAYFLLSKFSAVRSCWTDCYNIADMGLIFSDFSIQPLYTDVEYPGKYGLLYLKAESGWWWGKSKETIHILKEIKDNFNMNQEYLDKVNQFSQEIGV